MEEFDAEEIPVTGPRGERAAYEAVTSNEKGA